MRLCVSCISCISCVISLEMFCNFKRNTYLWEATIQVSELIWEPSLNCYKTKLKTKGLILRNAVILGSHKKKPISECLNCLSESFKLSEQRCLNSSPRAAR